MQDDCAVLTFSKCWHDESNLSYSNDELFLPRGHILAQSARGFLVLGAKSISL
jgi:hypothetical protein